MTARLLLGALRLSVDLGSKLVSGVQLVEQNAVRSAFKAGITPARIARQFGISQSNVRKALASNESKR
jgi:DNA invertase Pin-like site-specific DNA recombinase